jgi:hypothetical protein
LITHPKGEIVIDRGTAVEAARDPKGWWCETTEVYYPLMDPEEGSLNQLAKIGMKPTDIKFVLHCYLHSTTAARAATSRMPDTWCNGARLIGHSPQTGS